MSHTFGRVVVGVDGSLGSLQALRFAVGHARAFGAVLVPVLAWTPPGGELGNRRYPVASLTAQWQHDAATRLHTAFDEALGGQPNDLDISSLVLRGEAGRLLVSVADRDGDLLVVGARPDRPLLTWPCRHTADPPRSMPTSRGGSARFPLFFCPFTRWTGPPPGR